jgi:hypothetical protein
MIKLSLISGEESREFIIDDKNIFDSLVTKSEKDIVNILKLSSYINDNISHLHRDEGISDTLKTSLKDGNIDVMNKIDSLNENLLSLTSGNSANLGKFNENIIEIYLKNHFPHYEIVNTSVSGEKCGDIVINTHSCMGRISVESKNYGPERNIPSAEIDKFKRDLMNSGIRFGIFISTNSKITGKKTIDYELFDNKIIVYVGPAGHDCCLLNLAIHYLTTINELDAFHMRNIRLDGNKDFKDKLKELSTTFEINLVRLNNCSNTINETEKKLFSLVSNLRKDIQIIISDFNVHLIKLQNDIIEMKDGTTKDYSEYDTIIDVIRDGRSDKNVGKRFCLERFATLLNGGKYDMKLDDNHIYFYKNEKYTGKINYKGKTKIDVYFKEYNDIVEPYNHKIVTVKNDNYIIELKDNIETWDYIIKKLNV